MRTPILALQNRRGSRGQHPGLLLQRYLCENATGSDANPEEKRAVFQAAIQAAANEDVRKIYQAAQERWQRSLPELTAVNDFRTEDRLIVGLGTENVLETGIRLHHTYGLPVLPGSALKGLAAHYCDQVWGDRENASPSTHALGFRGPRAENRERRRPAEDQGKFHRLLFGSTEESGCILFHDAWLILDAQASPLRMDVMTPHHPQWLDGSVPPTDFDSPVPVPFLSVAGSFRVAVSWCGPDNYHRSVAWTLKAFELLRAALRDWGTGGKTTSGYGRLREIDPDRRQNPFSASALGLPPVGHEVLAILLAVPKKDKPWRAKFPLRDGRELSGPILGAAPAGLAPGLVVPLVVVEIGERMIQFQWPQSQTK